jgi:hypothetical protein
MYAAVALAKALGKTDDEIWDSDWLSDWTYELEQAGATDRELDSIIATGQMPERLADVQFNQGDSFQFGLDEEGFENDPGDPAPSPQEMQVDHEQKMGLINDILGMQDLGLGQSPTTYTEDQLYSVPFEQLKKIHGEVTGNPEVAEDNTQLAGQQDEEMLASPATQQAMAPQGPGMQQPQQGQPTMENVDQDIQTWLGRFKAYDELRASKAPVMEKKKAKPDFLDVDKDGNKKESWKKAEKDKAKDEVKESDDKNPWEKLASGDKDEKKEKVGDSHKTAKGGTVTKTEKGLKHVKEDVQEADQEVLEWMSRFAKLGNMKGYGR